MDHKELKELLLEDEEVRKEYEALQVKMAIADAITDARLSLGLTQKQLSELTGIDQGDISKLESGDRNPTVKMLQKLATGMNMELEISFKRKN